MNGKFNRLLKSSFSISSKDSLSDNLLGLAGLIEGDGSIIVPKTIRNQNYS